MPIPEITFEQARLDALDSYAVLDTPPDAGFDGIVQLACAICATPVALVSLVTADRQWFKARVGFPLPETNLRSSVCLFALAEPDMLVIPDLREDPRTVGNPLVTGEPFVRFYAGVPLRDSDGAVLGSLCVLDHQPRPGGLTALQAGHLHALARQVMALLELRRAVAARDALLREQQTTMSERAALLRTQVAISQSAGDLDTILDALVEGAMAAVAAAEGGVIELLDGAELEHRAVRGNVGIRRGLRVALDGSLAGRCARTASTLIIGDVTADERVDGYRIHTRNVRSAMFAPVMRAGEVLGVLKLQSSRPNAFSERDLDLARLFAGAATAGLTEAREAAAQEEVQESEARYRAIFESAIDYAIVVLDLRGQVTNWNEGAERILGWSAAEMHGHPADVFFTEEDRTAGVPAQEMKAALETGRGIDERWHVRKNGARFWANGEMMALRRQDGQAVGFVKILRDRTEQRQAEAAQETLNQELSHRMKNTFAMVQAIAAQTLKRVTETEAVEAFNQRLHALSLAHDVLLQRNWEAAPLDQVVMAVLSGVTRPERFEASGPPVALGPRATLSLSLLLHELTTNAVKYGALSDDDGRVTLTWEITGSEGPGEGTLVLLWREAGGPLVAEPTRRGFGSRLIRAGLVGTGGVSLRYLSGGFEADMSAPLDQVTQS